MNRNTCPSSRLLGGMWEMGLIRIADYWAVSALCTSLLSASPRLDLIYIKRRSDFPKQVLPPTVRGLGCPGPQPEKLDRAALASQTFQSTQKMTPFHTCGHLR